MHNARARLQPDLLALIALGGAVGAVVRYAVSVWAPSSPGAFPWATFAVNVLGAFGLAVLHAYVPARPTLPRRVRALLGPGLLGGFTTFSTYSEETRALAGAGEAGLALLYGVGTLAAALLAVRAAAVLARRQR